MNMFHPPRLQLEPVEPQPEQLEKLNAILAELPALLRGRGCLNEWGWGMDDVVLLPLLRAFTVVRGTVFPRVIEAYLGVEATQMTDYRAHAL
jgi:glutaredoxin 2